MRYTIEKTAKYVLCWILILSLTLTSVLAAGAGEKVYSNTVKISDSVTYTNNRSNNSRGKQESYILELTPGGDAYPAVIACDTIYAGLTITGAVNYAAKLGYKVLGAVNSDFFYSGTIVPMGAVVEDGIYKSSPDRCNVVWFDYDGRMHISESPVVYMTLANTTKINNGGSADNYTVRLDRFNKMRTDKGGLFMFSEYFSTVSTRTKSPGWFVVFDIMEGKLTVSGTITLKVSALVNDETAIKIGKNQLILTAADASDKQAVYDMFSMGDSVTLSTSCSDSSMSDAAWATGGGDILIKDGAITNSAAWNRSISSAAPRTAIGVKANGNIVLYVIDGRDSSHSNGLVLSELAQELKSMGCVAAVNLDGGGSSAMQVKLPDSSKLSTVNQPSGGSERKCATYIMIMSGRNSSRPASKLCLTQDGAMLLPGASLSMTYTAFDAASAEVAVPSDISVSSESGLGTISGSTYTAGSSAGTDRLLLHSSTASGSAEIHIIDSIDSLTVSDAGNGSVLNSIALGPGESIQLEPASFSHGDKVISQPGCYSYSLSGDIGTVGSNGLLTAGTQVGAAGSVTVSFGGQSVTIPVRITTGFKDIGGHWAEGYIESLYIDGVVKGTSAVAFSPNSTIKRGDFMLMLYRAYGMPETEAAEGFDDVSPDSYYSQAICWAKQEGIALGMGNGLFEPEGSLTREQSFAFICRYIELTGGTAPAGDIGLLGRFVDGSEVSDWAAESTAALIDLGVVQGSNDGRLNPQNSLTRAEMSKILYFILQQ
ncbi:MAG: phosphodiester glycosidase family protein [Oscillospiraceae bacterium]|nr:phosphodiester glycosidase family protein [Oscillospiraceae bacterium]